MASPAKAGEILDDLSTLLSGILNSPEGMENLKNAASALLKGSEEKTEDGLSPAQIAGMVKIVSAIKNRKEDDRTKLLLALRPHLSEERRKRLDEAVKFLKIADVIPIIKGAGIF